MPKRRANGEGNIRKRKDGRGEGRYTAGYDANGKAITKNVLGKTQAEVKDKLRTAIEDSKKLDPVKAGSYTLEQWLKLWYSVYVEPQVRYSTKEFYHNAIDHHILPKLGSVKLEKLTMLQIQQFYNELLKSGRVQKKNQPKLKEHGLSPRMVQCVHVVLNKALEYAVEEKLVLANPAKKCKIPKNTRKEMNILPEALIGPIRFPIWSCFERGLPSSSRHRADWWALTPPFHPYRPKAAVCFLWRSPRITPPGRYPASCPVKPGLSSPSVTPKRDGRGDNPSGSRKLKNYSAWCAISSAVWLVSSLKCSTQ